MKVILLSPLAALFYLIVIIRNKFFDLGLFKKETFPVKIISVGNISVGGTGKTPVVAMLVKHFQSYNKKIAIVSRGYKGSYQGEAEIVDSNAKDAAEKYGDEPIWFARNLKVPVCVGRRRSRAVEKLLKKDKFDIIIADDAFQHRWLGRDLDIVLIDLMDREVSLLPSGRLREPLSSLSRANYVFFTKANLVSEAQKRHWYKRIERYGFAREKGNIFEISYNIDKPNLVYGEVEELSDNVNVVLATALARPESFKKMVSNKYNIIYHFKRPDHFHWSKVDLVTLKNICRKHNSQHVIMTEKDAIKSHELQTKNFSIWSFPLKLTINPELKNEKFIE